MQRAGAELDITFHWSESRSQAWQFCNFWTVWATEMAKYKKWYYSSPETHLYYQKNKLHSSSPLKSFRWVGAPDIITSALLLSSCFWGFLQISRDWILGVFKKFYRFDTDQTWPWDGAKMGAGAELDNFKNFVSWDKRQDRVASSFLLYCQRDPPPMSLASQHTPLDAYIIVLHSCSNHGCIVFTKIHSLS